ncbi:tetratricopeptide repeat protein [bacterium]|nr:tetratricopeptide repeat protein [bacterium]
MLKKILKYWILALIFLLPLFWLPFSFEWIEFNKLYLLFFLGWGGVFLWNLKMIIVDKGIRLRWGKIDWLVLAFLLVAVISFAFSQDRFLSLFGSYRQFNNGLVALLAFFALYLLIRNNITLPTEKTKEVEENKTEEEVKIKEVKKEAEGVVGLNEIFWSLFASAFVVVLWIWVWLLFGIKLARFFLKTGWVFSPASGTAFSTAVYLALMIVLVLTKLLLLGKGDKEEKRPLLKKIIFAVFLILGVSLLIIFDFSSAWIVLGLSLIGFIVFSLRLKVFREDIHRLILPIFLILISALFLLLNFRVLVAGLGLERTLILNYPTESVLWQSESWQVGGRTALNNLKNGVLGSGPGTFVLDYAKFKSERILKSPLWQIEFSKPGNNVAEILATMGFLGTFIFLLIIGMVVFYLVKSKMDLERKLVWGTLVFGAIVAQFAFYQNMILGGLFWLVLGIGAGFMPVKEKRYSFRESPEIGLVFETVTLVLILSLIAGFFYGIKFYLADYNYQKITTEPNLDKRIELAQRAVRLNPYQVNYQVTLSQLLIQKLRQEVQKPNEAQDQATVQNLASALSFYLSSIKRLAPNNVIARQSLANAYRDLIGIASGKPEDEAIKSYSEAIELEPTNPVLYTERGKVYMAKNEVEKAKADFQKAIDLTPHYLDAQIQMTFIEENEGKIQDAIERLEDLARTSPLGESVDLLFRLGWLYYNNKEYDKAMLVLERATQLNPFHANALFILGLAYEQKGETKKAIDVLERVAQLNPDNQTVKDKLKELKGESGQTQEEETIEEKEEEK